MTEEILETGTVKAFEEIPDADTVKAFNAEVVDDFRANAGKVGGQFEGAPLLLLTTTGAKSGQPRISPLVYLRIDGKMLIIGSFHGADFHPGWVHNLRANRWAHVEVGAESFDVTAHELSVGEREQMLPKVAAAVPAFAESQAKTTRVIPFFELQRV
jgi:deazaflavin-dependent oxidoreductase (nitroreductase family)